MYFVLHPAGDSKTLDKFFAEKFETEAEAEDFMTRKVSIAEIDPEHLLLIKGEELPLISEKVTKVMIAGDQNP